MYLETVQSLWTLLSSLSCRTLRKANMKWSKYVIKPLTTTMMMLLDTYSWASWTSSAFLSIFSIHPLVDRYSIYQYVWFSIKYEWHCIHSESNLLFDLEPQRCQPLQSSQHHPNNQHKHTSLYLLYYIITIADFSNKTRVTLTAKPFGPGSPIGPAEPRFPVEPAEPGLPSSPAKPWKHQKKY